MPEIENRLREFSRLAEEEILARQKCGASLCEAAVSVFHKALARPESSDRTKIEMIGCSYMAVIRLLAKKHPVKMRSWSATYEPEEES